MADPIGTALAPLSAAIFQRVRDKWTQPDGQLLTAVKFPETAKLEGPGGVLLDREPDKLPWLKVDILWGEIVPEGFGPGTLNRGVGVVQLTLFYPKQMPSAPGYAGTINLVDKARSIFTNYFGEGLAFQASSGPTPGVDEDRWKARIIDTDFEFWECNPEGA